ncbi:Dystrophin [Larimichthys crocea]|uniref:Dystrophin n=1 Tax=Larimichthys crocea TaxID=215358 RepID=A0A6G0HE46_LARCR|nr:Dystrophin [Larimichthys crocea]
MAKLLQFENDVKTLKKWMADVDVFLNEEWPALGDSEALEKQLEQCTALVNDIHTIQPSVNGINEVGLYLKKEAEPPFAIYIQKLLDELNGQWEMVCKQAYAKKSALKGGLDKTMALRKEMQEMQEWSGSTRPRKTTGERLHIQNTGGATQGCGGAQGV